MLDATSQSGVLVLLCEAEFRRLRGLDAADQGSRVGQGWAGLDRPYPMAYALLREAEARARSGDKAPPQPPLGRLTRPPSDSARCR